MQTISLLFSFLVPWMCFVAGQNGEFEGTGETSFGGTERLIPSAGDVELQTDAESCPRINLPGVGIVYKGEKYDRVFLCANGMIRFKDLTFQNWPRNFGLPNGRQESDPCLTPYWARVDKQSFDDGTSKMLYKKYEDRDNDPRGVFQTVTRYANLLPGIDQFTPAWVMTVTWENVRPLNPGTFGGKNHFQVVITTDNTVSIALYLYADIDWSVRALRKFYKDFVSDYPPVIGWNAGIKNGEYAKDEQYSNFKNSGTVLAEEIDDEMGNLDERGKFGIVLGGNEAEPSPEAQCIQWWLSELSFRSTPVRCRWPCPPSLIFIPFDRRFTGRFSEIKDNSVCILNRRSPFWRPAAVRCCYRFSGGLFSTRGPLTGSALRYHPIFYPGLHQTEKEGFENCCEKTNLCGLYYSVRPVCGSRFWRPTRWSFVFGDPHFQTLDGKNYTFNGCGWYTYFQGNLSDTANSSLTIQVRTTRVGDANATAFTGLAIKEGDSETVQVNLNSTGGFIIIVDGRNFSINTSVNVSTLSSGIELTIENSKTISINTPLGNGVRVAQAANGTILTFVASIIPAYNTTSTSGLSGNWDGIVDNDFTLPNGTVLPIDLSDSEIHYDFGEKWVVKSGEELYISVPDDVNFQCPENFMPVFLDDALQTGGNSTLEAEAKSVCGNDLNCLYDSLVTGNTAIGQSTINEVSTIRNEVAELENQVPFFENNITEVNVTLGETFMITLNAVDQDDDPLSFAVEGPPGSSFTTSGNSLNFTWLVNTTDAVNLTFSVSDPKNGSASLNPRINVCACQNGGVCFIPEATSQVTAEIIVSFFVMECRCPVGKTGRFCESQKDFCQSDSGTVCHPLVTCTNQPTKFICGPCPNGYSGNGHSCSDVDECADGNGGCQQLCANTAGSFQCGCHNGFTLNNDRTTCTDIDECSQPNGCAQLCNNTEGSFECYCRIGFKVNPNDTNNCIAQDLCTEELNDCAQICYLDPLNPGQAKCDCNAGYVLAADGKACEDVDECASTETNLCGQLCTNTQGSYNCSCNEGYEKSGQFSCSDIDECLTGASKCTGLGEFCENLEGSFRCKCFENWNLIRVNGTCIFRADPNTQADPPAEPPTPSTSQQNNAIRLGITNFQQSNWTEERDAMFRQSVVNLVNEFCNENRFRPQDCGVSQNQVLFNLLHVQRLRGSPSNNGSNALLSFYINYPNGTTPGPVPQSILASIIFALLDRLKNETGLDLTLQTPVVPEAPANPSNDQINNAVTLRIVNFNIDQWTTFYDAVFRRAVAILLNEYCNRDTYTITADCEISGSQASFNQTHVARRPAFPFQNGNDVDVSFYVNRPSGSGPLAKIVLASILTTQRTQLQSSLSQQLSVQTSAAPSAPPSASSQQTESSVIVEILSFQAAEWTFLIDRRFRQSVANRIASYCGRSTVNRQDCQITGNPASFNLSSVQRSMAETPSQQANNVRLSFYVDYPDGRGPMAQSILASVIKTELNGLQLESGLTLVLQTSFQPPPPSPPSSAQSSNFVQIEILNLQADQWTAIQDNRFRAAVANELSSYCSANLSACVVQSGQTSFNQSHVTRIVSSPAQDGDNAIYSLFVDLPNGNRPILRNLLAGIIKTRLASLQTAAGLQLVVQTSSLAPAPAAETADQRSESVTVSVSNLPAAQWSAIQDNVFRGSVAQALTQYCNLNDARRQECDIQTGVRTAFTHDEVQRVQNSPSQNGADSNLTFYASFPSGGTVSRAVLALVINDQLISIESDTGLRLTLQSIPTAAPPPQPTDIQNGSAVEVLLTNYDVNEWSLRDATFRENMAMALIQFCNTSSQHLDLCNISRVELFLFNSSHIQRLPNSPTQRGNDTILAFYANLPNGSGTVARNILASAFAARRNEILTVPSSLQTSPLLQETQTQNITAQQLENAVAVKLLDLPPDQVLTITEVDIKIEVARRMNSYCFREGSSQNFCNLSQRRKKRAVTNQAQFTQNDVLVIRNSIAAAGNDTVLNISVTYPGQDVPVPGNTVQDALDNSFQEDSTSDILNLKFALVNPPTIAPSESASAIQVRLSGFSASQWSLSQAVSFRQNMSSAVIRFCNTSELHLALCNVSRDQLSGYTLSNVQLLRNPPVQNGNDTLLSFFVNSPSGSGTLTQHVLATIFANAEQGSILSQPAVLETLPLLSDNTTLTTNQQENLVELQISSVTRQIHSLDIEDIKATVAEKMNEYCVGRSSADPCNNNNRNFTASDVQVDLSSIRQNGTDVRLNFYVNYPEQQTVVAANLVQNALHASLTTLRYSNFNLAVSPSSPEQKKDEEVDWPLILGIVIAAALVLMVIILAIVMGVARLGKSSANYRSNVRSGYPSRGSWEFNRASPYSGSPFESIDAIPGFDEDGLPSEVLARDQIY